MAPLHVTLDTSIKLGKVKKTIEVYSNDAQHAVKTLTITANVISTLKGHPKMTVKDPLVLFKGRCATCHVLRGVGKTGQALFIADCAMCHGQNAQGAVAMSLLGRDYRNPKQVALVRKMIAEGAPNNPEMPPFSKAHGGPLNDAEIDSLVTFLTYQHTRHLQGRLDTDDNTKGATPEDATTTTGHVP
jgi:mono/diheme cytochrome c family protein